MVSLCNVLNMHACIWRCIDEFVFVRMTTLWYEFALFVSHFSSPFGRVPGVWRIYGGKVGNLYNYLTENKLLTKNQSGFRPGDSCTNQLLSLVYEIHENIDRENEVRSIFLDMSKATKVADENEHSCNCNQSETIRWMGTVSKNISST